MIPRVLICLLFLCGNVTAATYYIDYGAANDSANGTSTSTPWKRHPYMTGWAGSYSHAAGDRFIFKGGVTWPVGCFQLTISVGGSSTSVRDYYGVDQTWFTGGSWIRPIFDLAQTQIGGGTSGAAIYINGGSWFTIDNLEIKGLKAGTTDYGAMSISVYSADHVIVQNCYIHDWVMPNTAGVMASGSDNNGMGGIGWFGGGTGDVQVTHCKFDQAGVSVKCGTALRNVFGECSFNEISYVVNAHLGCGWVHDGHIHHTSSPSDPASHGNAIEPFNQVTVYNNWIHDLDPHTAVMLLGTNGVRSVPDLVYNNLLGPNLGGQIAIQIDNDANPSTSALRAFNNTIDCTGGSSAAIRALERNPSYTYALLECRNNHIITTGSVPIGYNNPGAGYANVASVLLSNNLIQTPTDATAAGYTSGNNYQPTSSSASTVNGGTSLASFFTTDRIGVSRPQGSAWDVGAYEYSSGGADATAPTVSITAPTNGATVSGTTVSFTATAADNVAVASVSFYVDAVLKSTDTTASYAYTWDSTTVSDGTHTLSAIALDTSGNNSTTASISVTVSNGVAVISVSPGAPLSFGYISVSGTPADLTLVVTNTGTAPLTGAATGLSAPFTIQSGGTYTSLAPSATQNVVVRYRPTALGNDNQTISFTGGGGLVFAVTGVAYPILSGLTFGADEGVITSPFVAAGGNVSQSVDTHGSVSSSGRGVYGFTIPTTGTYNVSALVIAPDDATNSFTFNIDNDVTEPTMIWDIVSYTSTLASRTACWRGTGTFDVPELVPKTFTLTAGVHYLIIRGREADAVLGSITITANPPSPPSGTAAMPTFTPTGGYITSSDHITLACATGGATILYTLDGSNPLDNTFLLNVSGAINGTIRFSGVAGASGASNNLGSPSVAVTFTNPWHVFTAFAPTGDYAGTGGTSVTFSDFSFTGDGASATLVSAPVNPFWTFTIGGTTYSFTLTSLTNGHTERGSRTFTGTGTAKITGFTDTTGATIFMDRGTPSVDNAAVVYTAPFTLSVSKTIPAVALLTGDNDSDLANASFTVTAPKLYLRTH